MMCHENRQKGVTLSELLVTITILGILAAFAVPNMLSFVNNQRIKSTASDIVTLINSAKAEAVKHNSPIAVTAATVKKDGKLNNTAASWDSANSAVSYRISGRSIYGDIDYAANQDTQIATFRNKITITPKKRIETAGGDFNKDTNLVLIAYPNGSMKIASPTKRNSNTAIEEGVTVEIPVCIDTKCRSVIVAGNSRAYIGEAPVTNNGSSGEPPTTVEQPAPPAP